MAAPVLDPEPGVVLERVYSGLPEHYRVADEVQGFPLYRWLAGICSVMSQVEELRERIDYVTPGDRVTPWAPGADAVNLLINGSFELGTTTATGWTTGTSGGSSVPGVVTRQVIGEKGSRRQRITADGMDNQGISYSEVNRLVALSPGDAYYRAELVDATLPAGREARIYAQCLDAGSGVLATFQKLAVWTGEPTVVDVKFVAPPGTVNVRVYLRQLGNNTGSAAPAFVETVWDDAMLVQGDAVDYFDGDTENDREFTYGWTELPHASTSTRTARLDDTSDLTDPTTANVEWLPWLAQLVGVTLEPALTAARARDAVRYASSGWRAGTKGAVADAARSELTGTKFVEIYDHAISDVGNGGQWDVLVVTRPTETPNPAAMLAVILERGAKPAGVVLRHRAFETSWDTVTAENPTWADYTETWDEIQEAGF